MEAREIPQECPCGGKAEVYSVYDCVCGAGHIRYRRCSVCLSPLAKQIVPVQFVSRRKVVKHDQDD